MGAEQHYIDSMLYLTLSVKGPWNILQAHALDPTRQQRSCIVKHFKDGTYIADNIEAEHLGIPYTQDR